MENDGNDSSEEDIDCTYCQHCFCDVELVDSCSDHENYDFVDAWTSF